MLSGLTLLLVKPMWGFPAAWLALHLDITVVRSVRPARVKAALMVAIICAAVAVNLALAAAVGHPFDS